MSTVFYRITNIQNQVVTLVSKNRSLTIDQVELDLDPETPRSILDKLESEEVLERGTDFSFVHLAIVNTNPQELYIRDWLHNNFNVLSQWERPDGITYYIPIGDLDEFT